MWWIAASVTFCDNFCPANRSASSGPHCPFKGGDLIPRQSLQLNIQPLSPTNSRLRAPVWQSLLAPETRCNMLKSVHQGLWVLQCSFAKRASKSIISGCLRRVQKSFRCPFSAASFRLLPASQPSRRANCEVAMVGQALPANAMLTCSA